LPSTATQIEFAPLHVPPQVGNGSPPEQCSTQMHVLLPRAVQLTFGTPPPHESTAHAGASPPQNGGTHIAGNPGTGPTHVQRSGHSRPQGLGGGSEAHAQ